MIARIRYEWNRRFTKVRAVLGSVLADVKAVPLRDRAKWAEKSACTRP